MELSEHQAEAVELLRHLTGPSRLVGAAGTGKSTVGILLPTVLPLHGRTIFVAPTHTALRVLCGKAVEMGLAAPTTKTVTSLLWGAPKILHCPDCPPSKRRTAEPGRPPCEHLTPGTPGCPHAGGPLACGEQDYSSNKLEPNPFWEDHENVIVDESSMLQKDDYDALLDGAERLSGRMIFVGDHCQLPPVYTDFERKRCGIPEGWGCLTHEELPEARLTIPRRQEGGQVLAGARAVRAIIEGESPRGHEFVGTLVSAGLAEGGTSTRLLALGIGDCSPRNARAAVAMLANTFDPESWRDCAMVVHTNKQRVAWNNFARAVAGRALGVPAEGDVILSASKFSARDISGASVDVTKWSRAVVREVLGPSAPEECKARQCPPGQTHVSVLAELEWHDRPLRLCVDTDELAVESPRGKTARWLWGFAMTVHAAQGSGWAHVLFQDSTAFPDPRRTYTAATRARTTLLVFPPSSWGASPIPPSLYAG